MARNTWMAIVVSATISPALVGADEAYLLKFKEPAKGVTVRTQIRSTLRTQAKGEFSEGKTLVEHATKKEESVEYRQTILEIPQGQKNPSRLRRHYGKVELSREGKNVVLPYQNKTVLIEKKEEGPFRFRIEKGLELTGEDADSLDTEFNWTSADRWGSATAFLPKKPVRVGESWKFDPAPLLKSLKRDGLPRFDEAKVEATAKLVRVYRKDGRQFGVVDTWVEAPIKEIKSGGYKLTVLDGKIILNSTSDFCIDGSADIGTSANWVQMDFRAHLDIGLDPKPILNTKGLVKSQTTWQEMLKK